MIKAGSGWADEGGFDVDVICLSNLIFVGILELGAKWLVADINGTLMVIERHSRGVLAQATELRVLDGCC